MEKKTCRAKFVCVSETKHNYGSRCYEFSPVIKSDNPENDAFFKTTPAGKLEVTINNDGVSFKVGQEYYLDFIQVP